MDLHHGISMHYREALEAIIRNTTGPFTARDVAKYIPLPIKKTQHLLTYLATRGWLAGVQRGMYVVVPLGTENPRAYKEDPFLVATRIFSPAYISGFSAAHHWGFTDQLFRTVVVMTEQEFRRRTIEIQGNKMMLKHVEHIRKKRLKNLWKENRAIPIADPSQTIVDILDAPILGGGIRHAAEIVDQYCSSNYFDETGLLACMKKQHNKTVYKRLGYILEHQQSTHATLIETCRRTISTGVTMLDPTIPHKGHITCRWNLQVNATLL